MSYTGHKKYKTYSEKKKENKRIVVIVIRGIIILGILFVVIKWKPIYLYLHSFTY